MARLFSLPLRKMSKREIAAAAAKKYVLSPTNTTASAPADRYHSVITLITLGKAEEGENINREKFLQAAPICQTAFVAPRPHERELSGHERSTCAAVHALPAATRWQSQLSSLASATRLFASAWRVLCLCWRPSARQPSSLHAHMSES